MMTITPRASSLKSATADLPSARPQASSLSRCFTLVELLVVMGIIAVLGILTTLSYRGIAQDAKLASGKNTVAAVLDNARGLAMKNNRIVVVVFRPRLDGPREQYTEAVLCEWTGESYETPNGIVERYAPIASSVSRALPRGIKVACPRYGQATAAVANQFFDYVWATQTQLTSMNPATGNGEQWGELVAVMYAPNGTVVTRNPRTDSNLAFMDFNDDGLQRNRTNESTYVDYNNTTTFPPLLFGQNFEDDEPYINLAPFLAVFDDDEARELSGGSWNTVPGYAELIGSNVVNGANLGYINNNADRIHFNRYTGVVMK
jgi:hypothetical protein